MLLTKEQISEQIRKHAEKKNGLHDLMEIMIESMMVAENWSSAYHATDTATSIHRYSLSCVIRKRNVTDSREFFTQRALHRNR